jgi:hypothetical protein
MSINDIEEILEKFSDETSDGLHITEDRYHALAVELAKLLIKGDDAK